MGISVRIEADLVAELDRIFPEETAETVDIGASQYRAGRRSVVNFLRGVLNEQHKRQSQARIRVKAPTNTKPR